MTPIRLRQIALLLLADAKLHRETASIARHGKGYDEYTPEEREQTAKGMEQDAEAREKAAKELQELSFAGKG